MKNLFEMILERGDLEQFITASRMTGLIPLLTDPGYYTVFAPHDRVFQAMFNGPRQKILRNPTQLRFILLSHFVAGKYYDAELEQLGVIENIQGQQLRFERRSDRPLTVNNATMIMPNLVARNGILHIIDAMVVPEALLYR